MARGEPTARGAASSKMCPASLMRRATALRLVVRAAPLHLPGHVHAVPWAIEGAIHGIVTRLWRAVRALPRTQAERGRGGPRGVPP